MVRGWKSVLSRKQCGMPAFPCLQFTCYGEHATYSHAPVSILMTRMPGTELYEELWDWFEPEEKETIISEFKTCMDVVRSWPRPLHGIVGQNQRICYIVGTSLRSVRVPSSRIGPCRDEEEFNKTLIDPAGTSHAKAFPNYERDLARAAKLHEKQHKIVFSHGDLSPCNILVTHDGHLSAILDWESAGWYPEYWDFTTACMFQRPRWFWYDIMAELSEGKYLEELDGERALRNLTCDAIGW